MIRVKVQNSRYLPVTGVMVVELHVRHLLGEHYEVWGGSPGEWTTESGMPLTRKRRRVLNREFRKVPPGVRSRGLS